MPLLIFQSLNAIDARPILCDGRRPMERILLVDDEKSIMFAMSHYFRSCGYDVDCAGDAEAATLLLSERRYALAIVDIHLVGRAGNDGLDLAERICRDYAETAVIVMTALDTPETEQRAAMIGVRSFVKKPARLAYLANVAFAALGRPAQAV
jgi:DNA-binding response OmpR family regulator